MLMPMKNEGSGKVDPNSYDGCVTWMDMGVQYGKLSKI